jgi:hypothetical protein
MYFVEFIEFLSRIAYIAKVSMLFDEENFEDIAGI